MSEKIPQVGNEVQESDEPIRIRSFSEIMRDGEHKKPIKEKIDAMTYVKPFTIKEIDLLTIKRFIRFCRFNAKNDWGIGMKQLLDMAESDAKTLLLYDRIISLEEEVEGLKTLVDNVLNPKKDNSIPKGFGSKVE